MDNEKLQRGNELAEAIAEVEGFLEAFPATSEDKYRCQITIQYNALFSANVIKKTINADRLPDAYRKLKASAMEQLAQYKKEFEEL